MIPAEHKIGSVFLYSRLYYSKHQPPASGIIKILGSRLRILIVKRPVLMTIRDVISIWLISMWYFFFFAAHGSFGMLSIHLHPGCMKYQHSSQIRIDLISLAHHTFAPFRIGIDHPHREVLSLPCSRRLPLLSLRRSPFHPRISHIASHSDRSPISYARHSASVQDEDPGYSRVIFSGSIGVCPHFYLFRRPSEPLFVVCKVPRIGPLI